MRIAGQAETRHPLGTLDCNHRHDNISRGFDAEEFAEAFPVTQPITTYLCATRCDYSQLVQFFACDSIYAIARICYRPSVHPSVTQVDQSKMVDKASNITRRYATPCRPVIDSKENNLE